MKQLWKELKWDALLKGLLYIVLGVTALVVSDQMVIALGYLIGVVLILAGGLSMIQYLLRDARQNYYHNDFLYGLLGIILGGIMLYKVETIISLVPFMLGLLVLLSGISKLQDVIDMKRMDCGNWIGMLILAIINLILGVVLILNPFDAAVVMFKVLGVGLVISGLTDVAVSVYFAIKIAAYQREVLTFTEVTDAADDPKPSADWDAKE